MEAMIQHNYDDGRGRDSSIIHTGQSHDNNRKLSKMSTWDRDQELIDACRRGDVKYLRRAAASGVALRTVTCYWQGYLNVTLLHIASGYDVTLYTL